jgi:hypothetical protein
VMTFDVSPDRAFTSIGAAGRRSDGLSHVEVVKRDRGTSWVVDYLVARVRDHKPSAVLCDGRGPAASLIDPLKNEGVEVIAVTASEHAQACGNFYDAACGVNERGEPVRTLRHLGTPELAAAIRGAQKRTLADAWAWDRKSSSVDISPLVAVTLAHGRLVSGIGKNAWGLL